MAVLSEDLYAVPDGGIYPTLFKAGETVRGSVEDAAQAQGKLQKVSTKAHKSAPEKK